MIENNTILSEHAISIISHIRHYKETKELQTKSHLFDKEQLIKIFLHKKKYFPDKRKRTRIFRN